MIPFEEGVERGLLKNAKLFFLPLFVRKAMISSESGSKYFR